MNRLDGAVLGQLRATIQESVAAGLDGAQFAVALDGELVVSEGFGVATADTPMVLMQASRTVLDAALWLLLADGSVGLDEPVATYLPSFASNGKGLVTIRQIMTFTGGFGFVEFNWPMWRTREMRNAAYAGFCLVDAPGEAYSLHPGVSPWVIADVIHAVTGVQHTSYLRERVLEPLGLAALNRLSLGEPVGRQREVLSPYIDLPPESLAALPPHILDADGNFVMPGGLAVPEGRAVGFGGAGAVGTAAGLALLYQAYLHDRAGLWDAEILAQATRQVVIEKPDRSGRPITRSLSMFLAGDPIARPGSEAAFFGEWVSAEAFGQDGLGGCFVWADPRTGLSFAFLTNTVAFLPHEPNQRPARLSTLAARLV